MESKHFKVGTVVDIIMPKSHLAEKGITILEVHACGIVGQQNRKDAPVRFYSWDKIQDMEVARNISVTGVHITSGTPQKGTIKEKMGSAQ